MMPRFCSTAARRRFAVLAAIVVSACAPAGCNGSSTAEPKRPLEIAASADTAGWIVPCGCTSNQSGGLPRRGTLVAEARTRGDVLVVDVGGAPYGTSRYDRLKFAAILRGELEMGLVAHNLGASEAALGADELRRLADELKMPFVSANLRDAAGVAVAPAVRVATVGGRSVAIIGVVSPSLVPAGPVSMGLKVEPPHDAILATLAGMKARPDIVVVLAYLADEELTALAQLLPEVDVVIGGPTGQSIPPRPLGPTTLVSVTNKGKFIADLRFAADRRVPEVEIVELAERFADDARQTANVKAFHDELRRLDIGADETSFGPATPDAVPRGFRIAGSAACRACHAEEARIAEASAHGHAWRTLADQGAEVDSYCQQCHTTGFGRAGGFVSAGRTPKLVDVGCESCHGPSAAHAVDPKQPTGFGFASRDQCTTCHDRENSPGFEYDAYWKQIAHGGATPAGPARAAVRAGDGL